MLCGNEHGQDAILRPLCQHNPCQGLTNRRRSHKRYPRVWSFPRWLIGREVRCSEQTDCAVSDVVLCLDSLPKAMGKQWLDTSGVCTLDLLSVHGIIAAADGGKCKPTMSATS
jgi:hypothetical protein